MEMSDQIKDNLRFLRPGLGITLSSGYINSKINHRMKDGCYSEGSILCKVVLETAAPAIWGHPQKPYLSRK